jgi:uncharacterized metal-binding protein
MNTIEELPIIYSCSGCSNIAQLANQVAVDLNKNRQAQMSCIAGLGGDVKSLIKKARLSKRIVALDGCQLHCVKNTLARHQLEPTWHFTLTEFGIKKQYHTDFSDNDFQRVKSAVTSVL